MTDSKREQALHYRRKYRGLISIDSKPLDVDSELLSILYTPGVAQPCEAIADLPERSFSHSGRGNTVGILSDGTSALGLGEVGPEATMPILESKAVFFKKMAGLDVYPLAANTTEVDELVEVARRIEPTIGALSLEDIGSPRCFDLEERLREELDIPVLHNDQHGTAITALTILHNVCRLQTERELTDLKTVIVGAGAAGVATVELFNAAGIPDLTLCDQKGVVHSGRTDLDAARKRALPHLRDPLGDETLADALEGADVVVGLAAPNIISKDMVRSMKEDPVIIAGAAPVPEISPEAAVEAGASVVCTARFDYPNMVTDTLALPGMFRGVIESGAGTFTTNMKLAAARAIAEVVPAEDLRERFILPDLLDLNVGPEVAAATARSAVECGEAQQNCDPDEVRGLTREYLFEGDPTATDPNFWADAGEPEARQAGLRYYKNHRGVLTVRSKIALKDRDILGIVYIPGLGHVVETLRDEPERVYELSCRGNLVAVATNGSAVLGLGDIGPEAARPVMEGKSVLFKTFAGVEAFPLCIRDEDNPEQFIETVQRLEPGLGGVNLEDIGSPACFKIERALRDRLDIPVFHDDQHGTAVVTLAGLMNALEFRDLDLSEVRIVINGAGASAIAVGKILREAGAEQIIMCDSRGTLYRGREEGMNSEKRRVVKWTNPGDVRGSLQDALVDAEVFIGLSVGNVLDAGDVERMAPEPIIFAMANPTPEIHPEQAYRGGASVVATGRSDFPNQVNNAIAFPGIFRGALDVRATDVTESMKVAAAEALSTLVKETHEIRRHYILPKAMDFRTAPRVARFVAEAAQEEGIARRTLDPEEVEKNTRDYIYEGRLFYIT